MITRRMFLNTITLYLRMIITTLISLWLTRVVLNKLGVEDFGIYNLIGGVIALLSFLNSALMTSTQRFLSVASGENKLGKIRLIFSASLITHVTLTLIIVLVLELCCFFLFDGFLNIAPNRIDEAKIVYQLMVISTAVTIVGVPYNAVLNSNEDLWFFALVETISAFLKIGIIAVFEIFRGDALIEYASWLLIINILNVIIKYVWAKLKYQECVDNDYSINRNWPTIKEMLGFTIWNAFGSLAMIGRDQGIAVLLNVFWGTAINAVYGIANQLNGQLIYFSQMTTTSMTPQIMKDRGQGDFDHMISLSVFTSKLAFYMSAIFAIPLIVEMDYVLKLWLKEVPEFTNTYCSLIIYVFLVMELYPGLTRAILAHGNISLFQILTFILLLLPIPIGIVLFKLGYPSYYVIYMMIVAQIVQMFVTIVILNKLVKFNYWKFFFYILETCFVFVVTLKLGYLLHNGLELYISKFLRLVIVSLVCLVVFTMLYYFIALDKNERQPMLGYIKRLKRKIVKQ